MFNRIFLFFFAFISNVAAAAAYFLFKSISFTTLLISNIFLLCTKQKDITSFANGITQKQLQFEMKEKTITTKGNFDWSAFCELGAVLT